METFLEMLGTPCLEYNDIGPLHGFIDTLHENTDLTHCEQRFSERGTRWGKFSDFSDDVLYGEYLDAVLKPGMLLMVVRDYGIMEKGDVGLYMQCYPGSVKINWNYNGDCYFVPFRDIEIVEKFDINRKASLKEKLRLYRGSRWRTMSDFNNMTDFGILYSYTVYLKSVLFPGAFVKLTRDYGIIKKGDMCEFLEYYPGSPCRVKYKETYVWVPWNIIEMGL